MAPTKWSEEGGFYIGFDNQIHQVTQGKKKKNSENFFLLLGNGFYTDMSIWDVHRYIFIFIFLYYYFFIYIFLY